MTTRAAGQAAESAAERFLRKKGYSLVFRNYRAKTGEIDLIMQKRECLVFVEVRMRNNPNFGSGAETVTRNKQLRIINTAKLFLQSNQDEHWQSFRFDVVSIGRTIDWIPGAFTLD